MTIVSSVDPDQLAQHIASMHRDVANETGHDLHFHTRRALAEALGYPADFLDRLPAQGVNSFAGVAYHFGLTRLVEGEHVLDLGSGSGMDVFAAGVEAGRTGSVVGVDITPEQLAKAESLRRADEVTFRRARIEELPFDDASFDVVISNGVVNLSDDKSAVFAEAARVLRPGGRLALADIVTEHPIAARTAAQPEPLGSMYRRSQPARGLPARHHSHRRRAAHRPAQQRAYRFASERAQRTSDKYGAQTIELLAVKPTQETLK